MTQFTNIIYSPEAIAAQVKHLAHRITAEQAGTGLELVVLMQGALVFMADLIRHLDFELSFHSVRVKSYEGETQGKIQFNLDFDPKGRKLMLVDDILDSGNSLNALKKELLALGASEVLTCCLLDKGKSDFTADYTGLHCPDSWVVGYGMDHNGLYRNLPFIAELPQHLR
ncbi:MAG: phosphoribosyltransferase family protein [bacterium]|nr:phosphoribosyltransferase family protein [bacterium]